MSEQQGQKRGVRSEAQKTERAREGYDPLPPSNPVAGAFGEHDDGGITDVETAFRLGDKAGRNQSNDHRRESSDED